MYEIGVSNARGTIFVYASSKQCLLSRTRFEDLCCLEQWK